MHAAAARSSLSPANLRASMAGSRLRRLPEVSSEDASTWALAVRPATPES